MKNERAFMALALAAGGIFALALGIRSAQPLFISSINSATGIGYAMISLNLGQIERPMVKEMIETLLLGLRN